MVQAFIQNLLNNVRPEEVGLEPVEILAYSIRNTNSVAITLPTGYTWSDFECIDVGLGIGTDNSSFNPSTISNKTLLESPTSWVAWLSYTNILPQTTRCVIVATSDTTATATGSSESSATAYPLYMVGYKRRTSQTSLESLIAVVSQPNLLLNTWHGSPKVRNQRNFDGDWSALAIGVYGLDGWFKYSATHKAQIIEAGSYLPSKKTVVQADGIILGDPVSPSDGGNWLIAVPFDADFIDACHANIKRPYSIETDARLDDCLRQYYAPSGRAALLRFTATASPTNTSDWMPISLHVPMRDVPDITLLEENSANVSSVAPVTITKDGFYLGLSSSSTNVVCYWYGTFIADATLSISDVTDDIEHRVILG